MAPDITVIIATYNRAQELARTLEGMARTGNGGLAVQFVVIDNGSTDQTKLVVDSFSKRIPIHYIFEARSGKNRALNTALENCDLGEIVVFTDDDVDASPDWLISINQVCKRWPTHSVFGGRINVVYPIEKIPKWATDPFVSSLAFAHHNYSNEECIYRKYVTPFGPNLWVRREIFSNGRRFDERVGPRQTNRIGGSEISFLTTLQKDGYEIVYSPTAVVGHRIQPEVLKSSIVYSRSYRWGRAKPYIYGLPQQALLINHPAVWHLKRYLALTRTTLTMALLMLFTFGKKRLISCAPRFESIGYDIEAIRFAKKNKESSCL
jgi:glycosyltransferase involved in cell wall biosynthesis